MMRISLIFFLRQYHTQKKVAPLDPVFAYCLVYNLEVFFDEEGTPILSNI